MLRTQHYLTELVDCFTVVGVVAEDAVEKVLHI